MKKFFFCGFVASLVSMAFGQKQQELRFAAGALQETTYRILADSSAWQVLLTFAERDEAANAFFLKKAALEQAKQFGAFHAGVLSAKNELLIAVRNGAKVFCSPELDEAMILRKAYESAIGNGNVKEARPVGEKFRAEAGLISRLVVERRRENVDAKLAQKTGIVDRRKGILGGWNGANVGDLFAASDAIRTGAASLAQLAFTDGMDVMVDPNTTVVIRESKMDKLDNTIRRDMALVSGSLLSKLSAKSKEMNNLTLQAGSSESFVRSGKFWVSSGDNQKVRLSNYDGSVDVSASKQKVNVRANQGTIVEKGKPPMKPVNLLDAPRLNWPRLDSVIYDHQLQLEWERVASARHYQIEISPSQLFDRQLGRYTSQQTSFRLANIPMATVYIRLQSIDHLGLRGMDSPIYVVTRNQDTQPPPIHIDGWEIDRKYTILEDITIRGKTEPGARLTRNGDPVVVGSDGRFSIVVVVDAPEVQVKLSGTDQSNNRTDRTLSIMKMDVQRVGTINWNCPAEGDRLTPASDVIGAGGNAYPRVKVTGTIEGQTVSVQTNSTGQWALSLRPVKGATVRMVFDSIDDQKTILTRTFTIVE